MTTSDRFLAALAMWCEAGDFLPMDVVPRLRDWDGVKGPLEVMVDAGDTYACVNSGTRNESGLEEGGFVSSGTRQVRVSKSAMVTAPALGSVMVLDGVDVRCVGVGEREWDVAWHLELEPERA